MPILFHFLFFFSLSSAAQSKYLFCLLILSQDFSDYGSYEGESDDDSVESGEECTDSEIDDENEEWMSSNDTKTDCSDDDEVDVQATAEAALKKLVPYSLEEFEKVHFCGCI